MRWFVQCYRQGPVTVAPCLVDSVCINSFIAKWAHADIKAAARIGEPPIGAWHCG